MLKNIEADAARDLLCALETPLRAETVSLSEASGRVLAADITAPIPTPPFDRSPYDGYAFRGADTSDATREKPAILKITEELPAGKVPTVEITAALPPKSSPEHRSRRAPTPRSNMKLRILRARKCGFFEPIAPNTDIVRAGGRHQGRLADRARGGLLLPPRWPVCWPVRALPR